MVDVVYFSFFLDFSDCRKALLSEDTSNFRTNLHLLKINNGVPKQFLFLPSKCMILPVSSMATAVDSARILLEDEEEDLFANCQTAVELSRVNYLVLVLHKSARSFSLAIQELDLATTAPPLAMAWAGVDIHSWHKNLAYQVCFFLLLTRCLKFFPNVID